MSYKPVLAVFAALFFGSAEASDQKMLNASYDIARELFTAYNQLFIEHWKETTGNKVEIRQSHAGSSKQANAILHGMKADVVTLNQVTDVQALSDKGHLLAKNWATRLPNNSSPYYSTIAFLVRKGNPKKIRGWADLVKEEVGVVFPNPKTSGNGRYTYLAALGYAQDHFQGEDAQYAYLKKLLAHVVVFDTGGRGATTSFVERDLGDALITFESEVHNIQKEYPAKGYEVIVPNPSILAEFPVAWIDRNVEKNGTEALAREYLNYLYSTPAQKLLASFHYRVRDPRIIELNADKFPQVQLKTVEEIAGTWPQAMKMHFASGARLDQLQQR